MRLHIAGHGGTALKVLQLKFDYARFQLNPGFGRQTIVNQCSIDLQRVVDRAIFLETPLHCTTATIE